MPDLDLALELQRLRERVDTLERDLQPYVPITPLYSLQQAAALLPCLHVTLMQLLQRHRAHLDPAMYRHGPRHRRYRMLSHRDLLFLRQKLIRLGSNRSRKVALAQIAA